MKKIISLFLITFLLIGCQSASQEQELNTEDSQQGIEESTNKTEGLNTEDEEKKEEDSKGESSEESEENNTNQLNQKDMTNNNNDIIAIIKTNHGDLKITLHAELVPNTTKNFIDHAKNNFYDNTIFHRIIKDFMVQGGDPTGTGMGGHSAKGEGTMFEDEFHPDLTHEYGALSMANRGPNTNGSQFFIVHSKEGTPWLNNRHSVFGKVIDGFDILETIANIETGAMDKPVSDIRIEDIEIID